MEKFLNIKKNNIIYKKYFEWKEKLPKVYEKWEDFCNLVGLETESFVPQQTLYIVPTENDLKKFDKYFCKSIYGGGLRKFKQNSPIQKDWERFAKSNDMIIFKPNFAMDFVGRCMIGRFSTRMFDYAEEIYCSISANFYSWEVPEGYEEITGETFYHYYGIVEKMEEKKNENT